MIPIFKTTNNSQKLLIMSFILCLSKNFFFKKKRLDAITYFVKLRIKLSFFGHMIKLFSSIFLQQLKIFSQFGYIIIAQKSEKFLF